MPLQVTRGGLVPAKIINLSTKEEVRFMFNPYEYTITKSVTWKKQTRINENLPNVYFEEGGAPTLKLTLIFDRLEEGKDVRAYTYPLWKMVLIDTSKQSGKKGSPPPVAFQWGKLYFKSVITNISETFTLFTASGIPVRSKVEVDLQQINDVTSQPPQDDTGSGASGIGGSKSVTAVQGDRMDHLAAKSTGNPNDHRKLAAANNIDNPTKIKNGKTMKSP